MPKWDVPDMDGRALIAHQAMVQPVVASHLPAVTTVGSAERRPRSLVGR